MLMQGAKRAPPQLELHNIDDEAESTDEAHAIMQLGTRITDMEARMSSVEASLVECAPHDLLVAIAERMDSIEAQLEIDTPK